MQNIFVVKISITVHNLCDQRNRLFLFKNNWCHIKEISCHIKEISLAAFIDKVVIILRRDMLMQKEYVFIEKFHRISSLPGYGLFYHFWVNFSWVRYISTVVSIHYLYSILLILFLALVHEWKWSTTQVFVEVNPIST